MKKIIIVFILILTLSGCTNRISDEEKLQNSQDFLEKITENRIKRKLEREKDLKPICEQEEIPIEHAKDCYLYSIRFCRDYNSTTINKNDLEKCLPFYLNEDLDYSINREDLYL